MSGDKKEAAGEPKSAKEPTAGKEPVPAPEPASASAEKSEIDALRAQAAKAEEYLDLARRKQAEFENYQKRIARDRQRWRRDALVSFVSELLPALDGLALARFDDPKLEEAVRLLEKEFHRVLLKQGVAPIETKDRRFDPHLDEAVAVEPRDDVEDGAILEVVRRGWTLDGEVVRAACVKVAQAAKPAPGPDAEKPGAGTGA